MKKSILTIACAFIALANNAYAAETISADAAHSSALYNNHPIDPKCIYDVMSGMHRGAINLQEPCREFQGDGFAGLKATRRDTHDKYGYDFIFSNQRTGGFYYRVIGKLNDQIIIHTTHSTGGSGHFSDLGVYEIIDNNLSYIHSIAGGDRCRGGIIKAEIKENELFYSYNIGNSYVACTATMNMRMTVTLVQN